MSRSTIKMSITTGSVERHSSVGIVYPMCEDGSNAMSMPISAMVFYSVSEIVQNASPAFFPKSLNLSLNS